MDVTILKSKNLAECLEIDENAIGSIWSKEQWKRELSDKERLCIGLFESKILIAIASGWIVKEELQVTFIAVHTQQRRKGFGKLLFLELLKRAKKKGVTEATLEVDIENLPAISLYKSCGFKIAGLRKNYYKNGNDALLQNKDLSLSPEAGEIS